MSKQQEKAFLAMKRFLHEHKEFSIWEINKYVMSEAGTVRIAPGRTVKDWIEDAKERGRIVEYAPLQYRIV